MHRKISITMTFTVLMVWLDCMATPFGMSWISHPVPENTMQVWFRQTYISKGRPLNSCITIATTGYANLYINGHNVSTDAITPYRSEPSDNPIAITYNVTRFLRPDTNIIAVWYSPSTLLMKPHQIAIDFYGKYKNGELFYHSTDDSWLCRTAPVSLTYNGGEDIDATTSMHGWQYKDMALTCWRHAAKVATLPSSATAYNHIWYEGAKVTHTRQQHHFDIEGDSVVYDFGNAFHGMLRVTLRGTKQGQQIKIGPLEYKCNGEADEQAIQRFTVCNARRIVISGDENFDIKQIQKVEAMEMETVMHKFL